ncbi:hypothetical protein APHAL10511_002499 [Amanita phalloides]|nr:hypothetical protein APHAL10511_002499 [Amanita phalloides]
MSLSLLHLILPLLLPLLLLYIRSNDRKIARLPINAQAFSPIRLQPADVRAADANYSPKSITDKIPPKTGRRYIVVGGGGFLGGWIVFQLLERGEEPTHIRILDLHPPSRNDFATGPASNVPFIKVDISDRDALHAAFIASWPDSPDSFPELTVFHTAANIRFYERHPALVGRSARVNVQGTQNVVDAARAAGASVLVYTSSGSVCVRRTRLWLWPWQREPPFFVQVINDADTTIFPKHHHQFFSNYSLTKTQAERIVRATDKSPTAKGGAIRTGCLRPGNGIFGPGDMLCHAYLRRTTNITWAANTLQSFVYVENVACAHLLYEQRLIDLASPAHTNPDIGGQAFVITDPGPPITFGDLYTVLETLTEGKTHFTRLSATMMMFISYLIEMYHVTREVSFAKIPLLRNVMSPIVGDTINLQPPLFFLTLVHLFFDDSRARLPPEKGGLGYQGAWTSIEGLHKTVREHQKGFDDNHNSGSGGVDFKFFRRT